MRSSFLLPRRQQVSRICDTCRQQQQQQQQQQRNVASLSFLASSSSPTRSRSSSSEARIQKQTTIPAPAIPAITTTRSIHHSRALRLRSPSTTEEEPLSAAAELPPTPPRTHYDFFPKTLPQGPPPAGPFHIDVRALRREYLSLQARAHPDRHPPGQKARAEALSARVNEAFATLANPFRRAVYVLDLKHEQQQQQQQQQQKNGGVGGAKERQHADETAKLDDPELLGAVLEAREQVEEAQEEAELEPLREENEGRIAESERVIEGAFARDDLEEAGREVVRLRYWVNIKESIDNWERGKPVVLEH